MSKSNTVVSLYPMFLKLSLFLLYEERFPIHSQLEI